MVPAILFSLPGIALTAISKMTVEICRATGQHFQVSDLEKEIIRKLNERNAFLGEPIPLPNICPAEALRRTCCWGNLRWLARAVSPISQRSHLSRYQARDGYVSVPADEFWSDDIDNTRFGRPYDFSRGFFEQFNEVMHSVQHLSLNAVSCEGSDYVNGASNCRNCYLCFSASDLEDCLYCMEHRGGNDNLFCLGIAKSQYCYQSINVVNCYEAQCIIDCSGCAQCFGCVDCRECTNCIGCFGLEFQRNCFLNEQKSESEIEVIRTKYLNGSRQARDELLALCVSRFKASGHQVDRILNSENCSGSNITRCKNVSGSYQALDSQDCYHATPAYKSRDGARGALFVSELIYQGAFLESHNCAYCYTPCGGESCFYCYQCYSCSECFGCAGLKRNSYCILNKQYSKAEYFELIPAIVQQMKSLGEWGEFFPAAYSPHTYEESWAVDILDEITTAELHRRGYRTSSPAEPEQHDNALPAETIPDLVSADEMRTYIGKTLRCAQTGRAFHIQRKEIEFYIRYKIPLPQVDWRVGFQRLIERRERVPDSLGCVSRAGIGR